MSSVFSRSQGIFLKRGESPHLSGTTKSNLYSPAGRLCSGAGLVRYLSITGLFKLVGNQYGQASSQFEEASSQSDLDKPPKTPPGKRGGMAPQGQIDS